MASAPSEFWVAAMVNLHGWNYFRKLSRNRPLIVKQPPALIQNVVSGEVEVAAQALELRRWIACRKTNPLLWSSRRTG